MARPRYLRSFRLKPPYDKIQAFRSRVFANIPLVVQGRAIGVLGADRRYTRRPLDEVTKELLQLFATQAALAIDHARFYEEVSVHRDRLRTLMVRILKVREEEAKRIAHVLHDEAGQLLAAVHIALDETARDLPPATRERLDGVKGLLDQIEEQLRQLSHELRPTVLDDLGLLPALQVLAQGVSTRSKIDITVEGPIEERLPTLIETALYRVVQEALTNATKYSQARSVRIVFQKEANAVRCSVKDDGIGFDVPLVLARRGEQGLGLIGMKERVHAVGGTLHFSSAPGEGTEVLITIPLETYHAAQNRHRR